MQVYDIRWFSKQVTGWFGVADCNYDASGHWLCIPLL